MQTAYKCFNLQNCIFFYFPIIIAFLTFHKYLQQQQHHIEIQTQIFKLLKTIFRVNKFSFHEVQRINVPSNFSKYSTKYSAQNGKIQKGCMFVYKAVDHLSFLYNSFLAVLRLIVLYSSKCSTDKNPKYYK